MDDGSLQHLSPLIRISDTGYSLAINELPFGALRKAQRTLDRTHIDSDDDGDESDVSDSTEGQRSDDDSDEESKRRKVDSVAKRSKRDAASTARKNKHA
jgi:hypothetical protein